MIEILVANWVLMLNIYLVGYLVSLVVNLVLAGINDEDPSGLLWSTKTWFLDVFYLIGLGITIYKNKGKK